MPLVARDLLHGGAQTYGIMLGAFGMGAVIGALNIAEVRKRMSGEAAIRTCAISMAGAIAAVAISREPVLTAAALVLAGGVWVLAGALFNIGGQLSGPRWGAGRPPAGGYGARADRRAQRSRHRSARGSRGAVVADRTQRTIGGRDRVPRLAGQRPAVPQCDAGSAAQPPAQRRLWLVDRARYRRSRIVDRALSLPDLAGLSAPAQSRGAVRKRAASAGRRRPCRAATDTRPPHAGAAVRLGALEGRYARPRGQRGVAGGRNGGGQQYVGHPPMRNCASEDGTVGVQTQNRENNPMQSRMARENRPGGGAQHVIPGRASREPGIPK